jgi:hypothetical protein
MYYVVTSLPLYEGQIRMVNSLVLDPMALLIFMFENYGIIEEYPTVQWYDYTKIVKRAYAKLPSNYHLTLSYSEADPAYAASVIKASQDTGTNMAVVFRDKNNIPSTFAGMPVINGDKDDLRFLDPKGSVVALYAKGRAVHDTTGFVINN